MDIKETLEFALDAIDTAWTCDDDFEDGYYERAYNIVSQALSSLNEREWRD
jgi:hypothetical protein